MNKPIISPQQSPLATQNVEELSLWLEKNAKDLSSQGVDEKDEKKCLWVHAIRLSLRHAFSRSPASRDMWDTYYLSSLLGLVKKGLVISYSYHYRTSFLYDAFVVLQITRPNEENKDLLLGLYHQYVLQRKSRNIMIFSNLRDIISSQNYDAWKAEQLKMVLLNNIDPRPQAILQVSPTKKM